MVSTWLNRTEGPVFMLDIVNLKFSDLEKKLDPVKDEYMRSLKTGWYNNPQSNISHGDFVRKASEWFLSTKLNSLHGVDKFPCVDVIMGCTHFIESFVSKNKWNIQILEKEYAYYSLMGKRHTEIGNLIPNVPLIISIPNYYYGNRPKWTDVLSECEQKNIDIHIDCAWLTAAKGFSINFDHPNIKSFAMSMSKYNMSWNRIGLRWSRQRTMDSCTLISAQRKYNELTSACGFFMMDNLPRDYGWRKYGDVVEKICKKLDVEPTMFFYLVKDKSGNLYSIGKILSQLKL